MLSKCIYVQGYCALLALWNSDRIAAIFKMLFSQQIVCALHSVSLANYFICPIAAIDSDGRPLRVLPLRNHGSDCQELVATFFQSCYCLVITFHGIIRNESTE